ncbi:MAG: (Fe-S)-binding protein [Gammaproteobacteria bacterium]|nr:(Fe-S)-binding protein [Gammaproteobacteria bacterium]
MNSPAVQRAENAFVEFIDGPITSFFGSCVHCGLCAHACLFYEETGDPKFTPIYKLEPMKKVWKQNYTFWGKLLHKFGLSKPLTEEDLKAWEPLLYDSCTMCGRCSMVCPVGNDISYMIRRAREAMVASGYAPEGLKQATLRAATIGSPMGIKLPALKAKIGHIEEETGLKIPMDIEGADYLALLSSNEIMMYPEYIGAIAKIFKHAGVTWTLSSEAYEATNSGLQIGSSDIAGELVQHVVDAAEKLKVKTVISPECGHAYTAIRWEGPNLIGKKFDFKVKHILEVLDELREQGRLKTTGLEEAALTYHDPCQLARRGGVVEQPRRLLNMVAADFREMDEHGVMNWCCGGGGGVSANERAADWQLIAFNKKKSQVQALGVNTMVTACANCRMVLEEGIEENDIQVEVLGLTELLADYLDTK